MVKEPESTSPLKKLKEIYRTANKEHISASLGQRAMLGATFTSLGFEWGSGNEALLGYVGGRAHELTDNAVVAGLAAGSVSFAEQGMIGALMALTIHSYPEVTAKVREMITDGKEKESGRMNRYASAMVLGAGVELAKENASKEHSRRENFRHATSSAAMIAISNTAIVGGLSGLLKLGEENGFEAASETIVSAATNPLTYAGLIATGIGYNKIKKRITKRKDKKIPMPQETIDNLPSSENVRQLKTETEELLKTNDGMTISVTEHIPVEEYDELWNMVETGFQDLNRRSYEKQDMTRDELVADLESDKVWKYVARDADSNIVGLLTGHLGLSDITWADVDIQKEAQDEADPNALPFYVGTIVVPVSERGTSAATNLIRASLLHLQTMNRERNENALCFFDCAEANYPWLPEFIQSVGSPSEQVPDLTTEVKELYVDTWIQDNDGIKKIHDASDDVTDPVIDRQHFFAISANH